MAKPKTQNPKPKTKMWSFPTISQCPRCGGTQTRAISTQGKVQYRKCLAPICQKRYTVIGQKVKSKKVKGKILSSSSSSSSA